MTLPLIHIWFGAYFLERIFEPYQKRFVLQQKRNAFLLI